jgi:hypothetical protein
VLSVVDALVMFSTPRLCYAAIINPLSGDVNNSGCVLQILGASSEFQATLHDEAHCAFMTLSPYTKTREGEAHHLIRICSQSYNYLPARGDAGTYPSHQRCAAALVRRKETHPHHPSAPLPPLRGLASGSQIRMSSGSKCCWLGL